MWNEHVLKGVKKIRSFWNEDILKAYLLDFYLKSVVFSGNAKILSVFHYPNTLINDSEFGLSQSLNLQVNLHSPPRHRNTGFVSSGASLTSWGKGASLALVGHPTSDGITIKIPCGVVF